MSKKSKFCAALGSAFLVIALLAFGNEIKAGIIDGLNLCGQVVIPSLFPFMVLAGFADKSGAARALAKPFEKATAWLFKIPKEATASFLLSLIGGYPVGANGVAELYKKGSISRSTAQRMLCFCINAGPGMAIVAVGKGLMGNVYVGWVIYLSHILSSVIIGWFLGLFAPFEGVKAPLKKASASLPDAFVKSVSDACSQMVTVCGYILLFSAVARLFDQFGWPWPAALSEVTTGTRFAVSQGLSAPIICGLICFGGFSVICQVLTLSHGLIGLKLLLLSRLAASLLGWLICTIGIKLLGQSIEVLSNTGGKSIWTWPMSVPLSVAMLMMSALFLCTLSQKA